jgi:hypothetical protein
MSASTLGIMGIRVPKSWPAGGPMSRGIFALRSPCLDELKTLGALVYGYLSTKEPVRRDVGASAPRIIGTYQAGFRA